MSKSAIDERDAEIYAYSYRALFMTVLMWLSAMFVGLVAVRFWEMLVFMAFFVPLRQYAGGLHLSSKKLCYIGTVAVFAVIAALSHLPNAQYMTLCLGAALPLSCLCIFIFAPQEHKNKPFSNNERRHFKKMSRLILLAEMAVSVLLCFLFPQQLLGFFALCGIHMCAVLVTVSAASNKFCDNKNTTADLGR